MGKRNNDREVLLALLSGAALGTVASILLAPEKGEIIRNRIKLRTGLATKKLETGISRLSKNMMESGDELGYTIGAALAKTTVSLQEAIDIIERKVQELRSKSDIEATSNNPGLKKKKSTNVHIKASVER